MPILGAYCVNIDYERCTHCGTCVEVCPHKVYEKDDGNRVQIVNDMACVGCRICMEFCPNNATHIKPAEPEYFSRSLWTFQTIEHIHHQAQTGKYLLRGFGAARIIPHFDDFVIIPSQLASPPPLDKYREDCDVSVVIGEETVKYPIKLKIPIVFGAMSFGALSKEAKMSLAIAAYKMGTIANTGEGGAVHEEYPLVHGYNTIEELKNSGKGNPHFCNGGYLTVQWSTGRWGVNLDFLHNADAIEVKIGQGAKPGMGGHLLGKKVVEEVARVRGIPIGTDALSPPRYYDTISPEDLKIQIEIIRDITDYKVPILIKLGPSRPYHDVKIAAELKVDAISIDGMVGGTGASPESVTQHAGIPTIACIPPAVQALKDMGLYRKIKLIALGGIRGGADAFKALALGADAVGIGTAAEIAMGCRACMACHQGICPYGITTNKPELRARLDPEKTGQRLANFLKAMTDEIKIFTMLSGHKSIKDLSKEDLRALSLDAAAITGVKLAGLDHPYPQIWEEYH
ncbi:MAG: glutamate synthase-related protein [Promethearchaeota archaeon]